MRFVDLACCTGTNTAFRRPLAIQPIVDGRHGPQFGAAFPCLYGKPLKNLAGEGAQAAALLAQCFGHPWLLNADPGKPTKKQQAKFDGGNLDSSYNSLQKATRVRRGELPRILYKLLL